MTLRKDSRGPAGPGEWGSTARGPEPGDGAARPVVAIARNDDEGTAIREVLGHLPLRSVLPPGEVVVLVPNWVNANPPETGAVVGPRSLWVVIEELKRLRPRRLVVAAGSGGDPTSKVFRKVGYDRVIAETGVEFVDLNYGPYTEIELPVPGGGGRRARPRANEEGHGRSVFGFPSRLKVNRLYDEADALVSYTVIKVHEEAVVSLGLKNVALSWPPAELHGYPKAGLGIHEDLHAFIAAMAYRFPITLSLVSGCPAMIGTGPTIGKAVQTGVVVGGTDPVAVDVVGARLLGFRPQAVGYLHQLIREGYGEGDLRRVDLRGLSLHEAEAAFSRAAYGTEIVLDRERILPVHIPADGGSAGGGSRRPGGRGLRPGPTPGRGGSGPRPGRLPGHGEAANGEGRARAGRPEGSLDADMPE